MRDREKQIYSNFNPQKDTQMLQTSPEYWEKVRPS